MTKRRGKQQKGSLDLLNGLNEVRSMSLFQNTFGAKEVAQAAGTTAGQVAEWARRGFIVSRDGGGSSGVRRRYSWFNVVQTVVAVRLRRQCGLSLPAAFEFGHCVAGHMHEPDLTVEDIGTVALCLLNGIPVVFMGVENEYPEVSEWAPFVIVDVPALAGQLREWYGALLEER